MNADNIIKHIQNYLFRRYGKNSNHKDISVRFNSNRTSFYIYNNSGGRPFCVATIRVSDHGPSLQNYLNNKKNDFRYPAPRRKLDPNNVPNISVEFYDPNHPFEYMNNQKSPYTFDVLRYCYKAPLLTMDDVNEILINIIYFIENPGSKFEDPFDQTRKHGTIKKGTGYKANVSFDIPKDAQQKFGRNFNFWKVINPYESTSGMRSYMFISFDDTQTAQEIAEHLIEFETAKTQIFESLVPMLKDMFKSL